MQTNEITIDKTLLGLVLYEYLCFQENPDNIYYLTNALDKLHSKYNNLIGDTYESDDTWTMGTNN